MAGQLLKFRRVHDEGHYWVSPEQVEAVVEHWAEDKPHARLVTRSSTYCVQGEIDAVALRINAALDQRTAGAGEDLLAKLGGASDLTPPFLEEKHPEPSLLAKPAPRWSFLEALVFPWRRQDHEGGAQ